MMEAIEQLSAIGIDQRLQQLTSRERKIKMHPSHDAQAILDEEAVLDEISKEKRRLARLLIDHRDEVQQQRNAKAQQKAAERDEALARITALANVMDEKVRAFEEFADFYNEILELTAKAQSSNIYVGMVNSSESKNHNFLTTDRLERLLRAACIQAFGAGQFIEVTRSEQVKYVEFDFEEDLGRALRSLG